MITALQDPRTASIRDLRNRFADVAKWIEDGEQVTITRNGTTFAILAPARPETPRKIDWVARFKNRKPLGQKMTKAEHAAWEADMRGSL